MLLCAELLLRHLRLAIPDLVVKAYADDTAIVSRDIWRDGPMLAKIFKDFSATSGLHLSLRKCFFMPLFPDKLGTLRCQLRERIPIWADMIIDYKGKYFGFVMGSTESGWILDQTNEKVFGESTAMGRADTRVTNEHRRLQHFCVLGTALCFAAGAPPGLGE